MTHSLLRRFDEKFLEVLDHHSGWPEACEALKKFLRSALEEMIVEMEGKRYLRPDQQYPVSEYEKTRNAAINDCITIIKAALENGNN